MLLYYNNTRCLHTGSISLKRNSLNFFQKNTLDQLDKPIDENHITSDEIDDLLFNIEVDLCSELEYIPSWDIIVEESYQDNQDLFSTDSVDGESIETEDDLSSLNEEFSDYTLYLNESLYSDLNTIYKTSNIK